MKEAQACFAKEHVSTENVTHSVTGPDSEHDDSSFEANHVTPKTCKTKRGAKSKKKAAAKTLKDD